MTVQITGTININTLSDSLLASFPREDRSRYRNPRATSTVLAPGKVYLCCKNKYQTFSCMVQRFPKIFVQALKKSTLNSTLPVAL